MEYIPMKALDGTLLGHARVKDGFVELKLRDRGAQNALVLTEAGSRQGRADTRIAANGRVTAVAAHEEGRLVCYGAARGASVTPGELKRFLVAPAFAAANPATAGLVSEAARGEGVSPRFSIRGANSAASSPRAQRFPVAEAAAVRAADARPARSESAVYRPSAAKPTPREVYHPVPETIIPGANPVSVPVPTPPPGTGPAQRKAAVGASPRARTENTPVSDASQRINAPGGGDILDEPLIPEQPMPFAPVPFAPVPDDPAPKPESERSVCGDGASIQQEARSTELDAMRTEFAAAAAPTPPDAAESAADSESFFALLRRADAVFRAIGEPVLPPAVPEEYCTPHSMPSIHTERTAPSGPARDPSAAGQYTARAATQNEPLSGERFGAPASGTAQWHSDVDALLRAGRQDAPAAEAEQEGELTRIPMPNPFPHIFPGARFSRILGQNGPDRLEGDWRQGNERMRIHAVPGSYSPQPPAHLSGFTRFIRSRMGGFWVKVTQA